MPICVVWFNGPSACDFYSIPPQSLEIGCNFIERRRPVDHVCAYDGELIRRLVPQSDRGYWTRGAMLSPGWLQVPSDLEPSCSGTLALALAVHLSDQPIYVVGCDWQATDRSVFDAEYTWRPGTPRKVSNPRIKFVHGVMRDRPLRFVHPRPQKGLGFDWIAPGDFYELATSELSSK